MPGTLTVPYLSLRVGPPRLTVGNLLGRSLVPWALCDLMQAKEVVLDGTGWKVSLGPGGVHELGG